VTLFLNRRTLPWAASALLIASLLGSPLVAAHATTTMVFAGLEEADTALFNGDFVKARQQYTAGIATPSLKCDALYGLGATETQAQAYDKAESALTRVLQECPPTFRAHVLRAEARRFLNKNQQALADYTAALKIRTGLIDSYIYERMASISGDDGLKFLRLAAEAPRAPLGQLALNKRLLQIDQALNNQPAIIRQYQKILTIAEDKAELASAEVALADIESKTNRATSAYTRLQRVLTNYPETDAAFPALVTLVSADQPVDLVVRTRINIQNENYAPVIGRVSAYIAATPVEQVPVELYVLLGKAYRGLGDVASALTTFQKARDLYPKDPMASVAALEQAETYVQQKDNANALSAYRSVATVYPQAPEAAEA
jgi:tetratricopeptide (TPR) repeat protein